MNRKEFEKNCWNVYLAIENDFLAIEKFIAIDEKNYQTFSNEFTKQLLTICGELDVQLKFLCRLINANSTSSKIKDYANELSSILTEINDFTIISKQNHSIEIQPWKDWSASSSPNWWIDYQKVKHFRLDFDNTRNIYNYEKANLKNTFYALSALFSIEMFIYKKLSEDENKEKLIPSRSSSVFTFRDWANGQINLKDAEAFIG